MTKLPCRIPGGSSSLFSDTDSGDRDKLRKSDLRSVRFSVSALGVYDLMFWGFGGIGVI